MDFFVEVKGPRWEGELKEWEIHAGRTKQPKYLYSEARSLSPRKRIQVAIEKTYTKLRGDNHNLLVIVSYRTFESLDSFDQTHIRNALYEARYLGRFTTSAYDKLGGVAFFSMESLDNENQYNMKLFLNSFALKPLPHDLVLALNAELPESSTEKITIV